MLPSHSSKVRITSWAPADTDQWSAAISKAEQAHLAHAPEWFGVIQKAYGHAPLYLQAENTAGDRAVLPAFLLRSRLFGTVVASMPFLDGGGPCTPDPGLARLAVQSLLEEAARLGAGSVEFRSATPIDLLIDARQDKCNLVLPLPKDAGELWRRLDPKVRNQVRKAERPGLSVEFGDVKALDAFYDVFAVNMRDLGSPVHARAFFAAILEAFGDRGQIALVRHGHTVVGGLIALAFKDTLVVPWASSLRRYFPLCPNVLLYWETLAAACRDGFRRFDFGRSSRDSGTYRFKRQWGAEEAPLYCYRIPLRSRGGRALPPADSRGALLAALWRNLPLGVTRSVGPRVRGYLTQ